MSDLAFTASLSASRAQLSVDWYFDPRVHDAEQKALFAAGPRYVGHELMVPNEGDYHVLDWENQGRVLVRNQGGVELISNVCRHRQSTMLSGRGNAPNIVCPLHRWTYDMQGQLLGAPHFPDNPCLNLGKTRLHNWNGLLFEADGARDPRADLARLSVTPDLDFSGYVLESVRVDEYKFNWKTFIEVYLEDYHVVPFHPGLGHFVDAEDLTWDLGDWYSCQTVGINQGLAKPGTPVYKQWHEALMRYNEGKVPEKGAIWLVYYPNIMIEWYPHVLVVSTVLPRGPEACTNVVEFYYPEDIALFEREFVEAEQQAYVETAIEDDVICMRMTEGRRALYERGVSEAGPYQSPMEDGMLHFHEFLRRQVEPHL